MTTPPRPEQIELHRDRMWRRDEDLRMEALLTPNVSSKTWALRIRRQMPVAPAGSFYFGQNSALSRPSWAPAATRSTANSNIPAGYFFNPFAFVRPVVQTGQLIPSSNGMVTAGATGTDFGNVGRNVLRGPRQTNVDFSIIKRFPIRESKNIELRAEFFNLLNHVNFANPISNFNAVPSSNIDANTGLIIGNPSDFGRITSTSNNPRLIQVAVKIKNQLGHDRGKQIQRPVLLGAVCDRW